MVYFSWLAFSKEDWMIERSCKIEGEKKPILTHETLLGTGKRIFTVTFEERRRFELQKSL